MERRRGVPDLRKLKKSPDFYFRLHQDAIRTHDFQNRVTASWGLIARGQESLPILLKMLKSNHPDSREDAAGALAWLGSNEVGVVEALCERLPSAETHEERDSLVQALGELKNRKAIPALSRLVRNEGTDGDTRSMAVQALGRIVRKRFDRQPEPLEAAVSWLDGHPSLGSDP